MNLQLQYKNQSKGWDMEIEFKKKISETGLIYTNNKTIVWPAMNRDILKTVLL